VVAVIDGGVDTAHAALRPVLWGNQRELVRNGVDDDGDGLVDDARGWNWIGGADGRNVQWERLELTRLAAGCRAGQQPPRPVTATCPQLQVSLDSARQVAQANLQQIGALWQAQEQAYTVLAGALGVPPDSVTPARVQGLRPAGAAVARAKEQFTVFRENGLTRETLRDAREAYDAMVRYQLDPAYDPRPLVGDTPARGTRYGNADVTGPDALHGTHVAGLIAAVPGVPGDSGSRGIAPAGAVRIMALRAIPDGDERDKDVANAIRYAVDHGAHIINMSFGKAYSPQKPVVDSAVRYADAKGVLMVHAAGNDASDNDRVNSFPTATYSEGGRAAHWLEVGASTIERQALAAKFSNFGRRTVDLFAPGSDLLSTAPGGTFKRESGTSMAAPVVSGVAALLMAYFPDLTAADVKRILLETVTKPEGTAASSFGALSASGGIVNAYEAVRRAKGARGAVQ
jgi:subtilisin family serine protease